MSGYLKMDNSVTDEGVFPVGWGGYKKDGGCGAGASHTPSKD